MTPKPTNTVEKVLLKSKNAITLLTHKTDSGEIICINVRSEQSFSVNGRGFISKKYIENTSTQIVTVIY